jgi:hypothetical protein
MPGLPFLQPRLGARRNHSYEGCVLRAYPATIQRSDHGTRRGPSTVDSLSGPACPTAYSAREIAPVVDTDTTTSQPIGAEANG